MNYKSTNIFNIIFIVFVSALFFMENENTTTHEGGNKKKNEKGAGRTKIDINFRELEKLCAMFCTEEEIAGWFGVSVDTLSRRIKEEYKVNFAEYYKKYSAKGKIGLRRTQYQLAMQGSVPMLIFLGKVTLGQNDRVDEKRENSQNIEITIIEQEKPTQKNDVEE